MMEMKSWEHAKSAVFRDYFLSNIAVYKKTQ